MDDIKNILCKLPKIDELDDSRDTASVLIPFIKFEGEWNLLFEKRAMHLIHQPGEICFPGGKREAGESALETAIRETSEELLIDKNSIEIISQMSSVVGPKSRTIGIFIGQIKDYDMTFDPEEVDSICLVPIKWFMENEPKGYDVDMVAVPHEDFPFDKIPGGRNYPWSIMKRKVYFYEYNDTVIWGFTAGVMKDFAEMIKQIIQ